MKNHRSPVRQAGLLGMFTLLGLIPLRAQVPVDPNSPANNPDKFAWDLFVQLMWPALPGQRGVPDPSRKPGMPGPAVWETWKMAHEIYLSPATPPPPWDTPQLLTAKGALKKQFMPPKFSFRKFVAKGLHPHAALESGNQGIGIDGLPGEEVRVNQPTFDFIVKNRLYSIDGQEAFRATGKSLQFPVDSVVVKAAWRPLSPTEIQSGRFYSTDQDGTVYGLVGVHISSKALPLWFWCTFEQVDNPPPEIGDRDRYTAFVNATAPNPPQNRLRVVPALLQGSVWQYYVLRGTQIDFTDAMGVPIILGNTQLEEGMQSTASCMGCHARSTIGDRMDNIIAVGGARIHPDGSLFYPSGFLYPGDQPPNPPKGSANRLTVDGEKTFWQQDPQNPNNDVQISASANGSPSPDLFYKSSTGQLRYTQLDFLWEFIFSTREPAVQPGR